MYLQFYLYNNIQSSNGGIVMIEIMNIFKGKNQEEIKKAFNEKFFEYTVCELKANKNIEIKLINNIEKKKEKLEKLN